MGATNMGATKSVIGHGGKSIRGYRSNSLGFSDKQASLKRYFHLP